MVRKEIETAFKVGRMELWRALTYKRNSKRAKMLRAAALERGGQIYTGEPAPKEFQPDVEIYFDHAKGIMRQLFGNRVELRVSRNANAAIIYIDSEPVATFDSMTLRTWGDVLYSLESIYNHLNA